MPRPRTTFRMAPAEPEAAGVVSPPSSVKSAARVLQIFELFDTMRAPLKVGEIAARLDLPQSSTSALLRSLVGLGYLAADPVARTFVPTARIGLLGSWCVTDPMRSGAVHRLMDELSQATGQTIILAGRNGIYTQYFHVVQATRPLRMYVPVGSLRMLVWSTAGFVMMRDMPEAEVRSLVRRTNAEAAPSQARVEITEVLARIAQARTAEYGFSRALVTPGTGMICVRLPIQQPGADPMTICVSGWVETMETEEAAIVEAVRAAIARTMQYENPVSKERP
ncbi:MAG: IclR family transcriptional regulator [Janthinobacterium lividum]